MTTEGRHTGSMSKQSPPVAHLLAAAGAFDHDPMTVVDVGCSGGLIAEAAAFSPHLVASGFDILEDEIERLTGADRIPGVDYHWGRVRSPSDVPGALVSSWEWDLVARSSAASHARLFGEENMFLHLGRDNPHGKNPPDIVLSQWLEEHHPEKLDFVKTDTDGDDLSVLRSLGDRLHEPIAIHAEVFFDVRPTPGNTLCRVWDVLSGYGFRLFDLELARYGRANLPLPFEWDIPAQTSGGQVVWGTALFFKDLVGDRRESPCRVLKCAALMDQFGLQDCAVELLEDQRVRIEEAGFQVEPLCDALALRSGVGMPLNEARNRFASDPRSFFRSRMAASREQTRVMSTGPAHAARLQRLTLRRHNSADAAFDASTGAIAVTGDPTPWSYAVDFPIPGIIAACGLSGEPSALYVAIDLVVSRGMVGLAAARFVNDEVGDYISEELHVARGASGAQTITFGPLPESTTLVIRSVPDNIPGFVASIIGVRALL